MKLTKRAIANLIRRYTSILKKCALLNILCTLPIAMMLHGTNSIAAAHIVDTLHSNDEIITIQNDTMFEDHCRIPRNKSITIDLNGYKIYTPDKESIDSILSMGNQSHLIIKDSATSGSGAIINKNKYAILFENDDSQHDSSNTLQNTDQSYLEIQNGHVTGGIYAIAGNANINDTSIHITGGELEGNVAAIRHPQDGTLHISNGNIIGKESGIIMSNGSLNITGGNIQHGLHTSPSHAALCIFPETINSNIRVSITNGTFHGQNAIYASVTKDNKNIITNITGGIFHGKIYNDTNRFTLSGGIFPGQNQSDVGGQLETYGTASISGVTFSKNRASKGGAIYNSFQRYCAGNLAIQNIKLTENTATFGGAIYNDGKVKLSGTNNIQNNTAAVGAAIYNIGEMQIDGINNICNNTSQEDIIYNSGNIQFSGKNIIAHNDSHQGYTINNNGTIIFDGNNTITGNIGNDGYAVKNTNSIVFNGTNTIDTIRNIGSIAVNSGITTVNDLETTQISTLSAQLLTIGSNTDENSGLIINDAISPLSGQTTIFGNGTKAISGEVTLTHGSLNLGRKDLPPHVTQGNRIPSGDISFHEHATLHAFPNVNEGMSEETAWNLHSIANTRLPDNISHIIVDRHATLATETLFPGTGTIRIQGGAGGGGMMKIHLLKAGKGTITVGNNAPVTLKVDAFEHASPENVSTIQVTNLGTLILPSDAISWSNNTFRCNDINVVAAPGGTVRIPNTGKNVLQPADIANIKLLTQKNGLLDIHEATIPSQSVDDHVTTLEPAYLSSGITSTFLKSRAILVTKDSAVQGLSGGFGQINVDSPDRENISVSGTLQLSGDSETPITNISNEKLGATVQEKSVLTIGGEGHTANSNLNEILLSKRSIFNVYGKEGSVTVQGICGENNQGTVTVHGKKLIADYVQSKNIILDTASLHVLSEHASKSIHCETANITSSNVFTKYDIEANTIKLDKSSIKTKSIYSDAIKGSGNITCDNLSSNTILPEDGDFLINAKNITASVIDSNDHKFELHSTKITIDKKIHMKNSTAQTVDLSVNGKFMSYNSTINAQLFNKKCNLILSDSKLSASLSPNDTGTLIAASNSYANIDTASISSVVGVGKNSILQLGSFQHIMKDIAQEMGYITKTNGHSFLVGEKALLTLGKNIQLNGKLLVDGSKDEKELTDTLSTMNSRAATFARDSLLIVDGTIADGNTAALTVGSADIHGDAKLYVTDAQVDREYRIITVSALPGAEGSGEEGAPNAAAAGAGRLQIADNAWSDANLGTSNKLVAAKLIISEDAGTAIVRTSLREAQEVMPSLNPHVSNLVNNMAANGMTSEDSENFAERFVNRAMNRLSPDAASRTLEGATRLAFTGAVPQMAMFVSDAAASIVAARTSFVSPLQSSGGTVALAHDGMRPEGLSAGDGLHSGFGMWIMPMYRNQSVSNLDFGKCTSGYASSFGGIVLGADYTIRDAFRLGMSFNVGTGHVQSSGDFNKTTNSFTYWGVNAYTGCKYGNLGFSADVGHTSTLDRLKQNIPSCLDMGSALTADNVLSTNFTVGLHGEYMLKTEALDIIPHVGARMNILRTWGFDVENARRTVTTAGDMDAITIWQFPAGITFSKNIASASGWMVKPQADLSVIPATGDLSARQNARLSAVPGSANMDSDIMDSISGRASIGLEARHDNGFSVGVSYSFQGAEHTADHGVQATFRYDF